MDNLKPRLIVVGGPNGSGKTSITEQLLHNTWMQGCEYVNPDVIADTKFDGWNDPASIKKAAHEAQKIREKCIEQRRDLAFETVFSADDKLQFLREAKKAGYFIRLFFISTDHPAINAARVTYRYMAGGHDVPISKIVSRYQKSIANCAAIAPEVDRLYVYDNSVEQAEPKLQFRLVEGALKRSNSAVHQWAQEILMALDI
ncbi:MAG: family ATPase [Verrucomicrobiaceae bacterium]|nr:family ATPase [Verrucomicrobiaceae bacterium]